MMDALEFVKNYREMLEKRGFGLLITSDENTPEKIVAETEKWAAEHPAKTRQSEFLKHYPDARIFSGCLNACPRELFGDTKINCNAQPCYECKKEFWLAEAEHPVKTRQSEFLKMLPNVPLNDKGQPAFCPKLLDTEYHPIGSCCLDVDICQRCMDNFWGQEVEDA